MILTMMALFSMTLTFAENESTDNLNTVEAYDMSVNMTRLGVVLGLSNDQMEGVAVVHNRPAVAVSAIGVAHNDDRSIAA